MVPGVGHWCGSLLEIAKRFDLQHDPHWREPIAYALWSGDEHYARDLCEQLSPAVIADELCPDPFRSAETNLDGEFRLGQVCEVHRG